MQNQLFRSLFGSLLALLCFAAAPAHAQLNFGRMDTGLYLGGSVGAAKFRHSCDEVPVSCDSRDTAWKAFAGYQLHRNFAIEAGYTDMGKASANGVSAGVNVSAEAKVKAFELVGVISTPLYGPFSAYAKLGAARSTVDVFAVGTVPGFRSTVTQKERSTDLTYGVGAKISFTPNFGARAEWQRYQGVGGDTVGNDNIDLFTLGLLYNF